MSNLSPELTGRRNILDHGFLQVVDLMGDDVSITRSARVSFRNHERFSEASQRLISYLMRNRHTTPFESCEIQVHVKCPIFVARQWMRHRTGSFNEVSGRYKEPPGEVYVPGWFHREPTDNKQGRGDPFAEWHSRYFRGEVKKSCEESLRLYRDLLRLGVCKEQARMILPQNMYTEFYWKVDLHNLFHFITLRAHSHAQMEIQVYAEELLKITELWVPMAYKAYMLEYRYD